ncbi:conserved putative membrane protein [Haemophilus influenzae 22.1-21]|nr:conserved putative membrane protein [Haemophilus influenzae 22.1-21]
MILLILGVLSNNSAITISAAVLLIMQQTFLSSHIPLLEKYGVKIGIIILTIGVLSPLVSGKIQLPDLSGFLSWKMALSIAVGVLVAWLAGKGVPLMGEQPIFSHWLAYRHNYWCSIFRWNSRWPTYCCRYISFTFRENLNEKQIPYYCHFKRILLCRTRRICSSWLKPYIRSQSIIMD